MSKEIHVGDVGTEFRIVIKDDNDSIVDLSTATFLEIVFSKPDGTRNAVSPSLYTDGTDGIIKYNAAVGDLDQAGMYKIQAYIEVGAGNYYSNILNFKVLCNL
jgi:hypothetical protein